MTGPRLPGPASAAWVLAGTAVSGLSTYALLIVVARALGSTRYGEFSVFWTFVVVVSIGAFLPVEQLVARAVARHGGDVRPLLASGVRAAAVLGALVVAAAAVATTTVDAVGADTWTRVCAVGVVVGLVGQFAGRGVLAGARDLRGYAVVLGVDTVTRTLLAVALWAAGVRTVGPFAAAVAVSCLACGVVAVVLARRACSVPVDRASSAGAVMHGSHLVPLVTAGMCMQILLNSAVVATAVDPTAAAALTGVVLAVISVVRLPVFVFQGAQAGYVARVAALALTGPADRLRRVLLVVAGAVLAVGGLTVAAAALLGPWAVRLAFGEGFDAPRRLVVLAAVGVAAYVAASVLNDLAVALGARGAIAIAWPTAVVAAAVAYVTAGPDVALRATLPLVLGAVVAALLLAPAVTARVRRALSSARRPVPTPTPRESPSA